MLLFQATFYIHDINRPKDAEPPTIKGTRALHQIECQKGVIRHRNLACFCGGCLVNAHCNNSEFVSGWTNVHKTNETIQMTKDTVVCLPADNSADISSASPPLVDLTDHETDLTDYQAQER